MKTLIKLTVLSALLAVPALTQGATTIVGSKHDLNSISGAAAYKGTSDQVCIYCHTPHNSAATPLAPLWNHPSTAVGSYTLYTSTTLDAAVGQPAGTSKACLSCHDGTVAADAHGSTVGTKTITGAALVGQDLGNDHPISFTYDATLAGNDGSLVVPSSSSLVTAGIPLFNAKLECASCHDVHNPANSDFLRFANTASALCLKCHVK